MPDTAVPVLVDFLNTVPVPLTSLLVALAPHIASLRTAADVASWKSSWYNSWLVLAAWWAVCLLAQTTLRYLLPLAILVGLAVRKWTIRPRTVPLPVTEHNLQTTISDLNIINSLIPNAPSLPDVPPYVLLRVSALLYPPYLVLTYFIPLRILIAVAGSIMLTWRASWATAVRTALWRNAWVRWALYHIWSRLSGVALPPQALSLQPMVTSEEPGSAIRFLFTIYENQRWWMGLDWTAALLPGERPSWSSAAQHPVAPPNAFTLPADTSVVVPDGRGGRVQRTATWAWEEGEWRVLIKREGGALARLERPLPREESPSAGVLAKVASRMKEANSAGSGASAGAGAAADDDGAEDDGPDPAVDEPVTDADGWVYADNKWEGPSNKGGLGKYTRYRRWTRIAVVRETVEVLAGEEDEQKIPVLPPVNTRVPNMPADASTASPTSSTSSAPPSAEAHGTLTISEDQADAHKHTPLRQRLKSAMNKASPPASPSRGETI